MRVRSIKGQRVGASGGFALVLSLVVVTVVAGLCAGFVQLASSTARTQSASVDQLRAFYLAEAGLAEAFLAVRMGRTGGLGTETLPAKYGDGYVFVESMRTPDARIWLRATSRVGRGRAVLGLIVQPDKPPLGFFAEEEIVIEATVHADGYDSTTRSYEDEILAIHSSGAALPLSETLSETLSEAPSEDGFSVDPQSPHFVGQTEAHYFAGIFGSTDLLKILMRQVSSATVVDHSISIEDPVETVDWFVSNSPVALVDAMSASDYARFLSSAPAMFLAAEAGALSALEGDAQAPLTGGELAVMDDSYISTVWGAGDDSSRVLTINTLADETVLDAAGLSFDDTPLLTERGAAIGSNGDIAFLDPGDSLINGSVTPGVTGDVTGLPPELVAGSTASRALAAELDAVLVPSIVGTETLVHSGAIPHVIGEGESGFSVLQVTDGAELVIRGPATIRVHDLRLDGGSMLSLDTRDGNVELFITGDLSMDPASFVETTAVTSKEVSIVAGTLADTAAPSLMLEGNSQFHGTVYAPDSTVRIGTNFEVFGSVSAKRLEIAAGVRLHFDDVSYNGELPVPLQESWQIIELPSDTAAPIKATAEMLAADMSLATAHNLDNVGLSIRYTDTSGIAQTYAGPESNFDWSVVDSVEAEERVVAISEAEAAAVLAAATEANVLGAADETDTGTSWDGGGGFWSRVASFAEAWRAEHEDRDSENVWWR